jgi:hypothetical protein
MTTSKSLMLSKIIAPARRSVHRYLELKAKFANLHRKKNKNVKQYIKRIYNANEKDR